MTYNYPETKTVEDADGLYKKHLHDYGHYTGSATLVILGHYKSCNCADALVSKNILQPGEIGTVTIMVDTRDKQGENIITTTLNTNTPQKEYIMRLNINVK